MFFQITINRQGPWTDVYAVAATLYFMLTAHRLPAALDRKQATLQQQPDVLKPARHYLPDLPPVLDAALLRALAVEPEQRLQSVAAFKQHLETALTEDDEPCPALPPEPPPEPQPEAPTLPMTAPERLAEPQPEAPILPMTAPERPAKPNWRVAAVVVPVIGLVAWGGWWFGLRTASESPEPPAIMTPPVVESPPVAAPPVVEPQPVEATPPAVEPQPVEATPPVAELPPVAATPPVVEPRTYLTVKTEPPGAQVRIMNIGPVYRDGIELPPGNYDLEVSAPGYPPYRKWHTLAVGAQELKIALPAEPPTPATPSPDPEDVARQQQLDLQLTVAKKLLEAREIPAARRALEDAKALDRKARVEAFRREQTTIMQAAALAFLEQGQETLAKRVADDLGQWDPQSPAYQALQARLSGGR